MFEINNITLLLWLTAILIVSFDVVVFLGSNRLSSRIFVLFSFPIAIWSVSYSLLISATEYETALIIIRSNYVIGIIISLGFIYFSLVYPKDYIPKIKIPVFFIIITLIFFYLFVLTDQMIPEMFRVSAPDNWGWKLKPLYFIYLIIFSASWIFTLSNIKAKKKEAKDDDIEIKNLNYMFWGIVIGIVPPYLLNIVFPIFGYYGIGWTSPILSCVWVYIIGYSIIRYRQMNVKIIMTEILAVALTIIFFVNIFLNKPENILTDLGIFITFMLIAYYLVKTVISENKKTEQLKDLNNTLEEKVALQTLEIKNAYELEKKARKELERLNEAKNQFILITQHNIRTPVNNIKSATDSLSSIKDKEQREIEIDKIKTSSDRLTSMVNDFLSISTITNDRNILNISEIDMTEIVEKILRENKYDLEQKNISVIYSSNKNNWPKLWLDGSKIKDALTIVIENAIKYNKIGGRITIDIKYDSEIFEISVKDSGIGMAKEDIEKINNGHFYRSKKAQEINPIGMGVGLRVAKAIVLAHHGDFRILSSGENAGTTVKINLPVKYFRDLM